MAEESVYYPRFGDQRMHEELSEIPTQDPEQRREELRAQSPTSGLIKGS